MLCRSVRSAPGKVKAAVEDCIARTGDEELMVTPQTYNRDARLRPNQLLVKIFT